MPIIDRKFSKHIIYFLRTDIDAKELVPYNVFMLKILCEF